MSRLPYALLAGLVWIALPHPVAATAPEGRPAVFNRVHQFKILQPEAAEAIAWKACPPEGRDSWCRITNVSERTLTVHANGETHAKIATDIAAAQRVPASRLFQVTLLQASRGGEVDPDPLPARARRVLDDAGEVLPYSGYRLLGSALLRTDGRARSIVNGPDGLAYSASLAYDDTAGLEGHRLILRQFSLDRIVSVRAGSEQRIEHLPVIGTSFSMAPGETVIVGTSKLDGGEGALLVLLGDVE